MRRSNKDVPYVRVVARKFTPHPYGQLITDFILANPRCAIWAGMGMGKTISTLMALRTLMDLESAPILVLAPLRVAQSTWPDEARKWQDTRHIKVMPIVGNLKERMLALSHKADIYTTNYENLPWLVKYYGGAKRWPFRIIVADESTKLKGFRLKQGTTRAKVLAEVAHCPVERFIELTGTPSPNGLIDLWGQMWFVDAGVALGRTFTAFKDRWFRASYDGYGVEACGHAQAQIQDAIKHLCLTVEAKDWFDLKEPIVRTVEVTLPPKARQLYKDMEKDMFMQMEEHSVEVFSVAARTMKCLQLANGAAYVGDFGDYQEVHDLKIQALESIIEESGGMPVLVAYNFKSDLARLLTYFKKGRKLDKDPQTIRDWNDGKIPVLFAHPASAGHGLNLQDGGNILVFFGHDWNLEYRLQIIERIGPTRQMQAGHDRPVFIYNIVAKDTVDEQVIERVETKRSVQDILMDAMKTKKDLLY